MNTASIHIRTAHPDDSLDLWRLAELDSAVVPDHPLMLAHSDGEIVAALSVRTGEVIADPFRRTTEAVELLKLRATQLPRDRERPRGGLIGRLRGRDAAVAAQ
jgi:hypothetical protein